MKHLPFKRSPLALCLGLVLASPAAMAAGPVDDSVLTARDREVLVDVLANDEGTAPARLVMFGKRPLHGSARVVGDKIRYVPKPGFTGHDRFGYFVQRAGHSGAATVDVTVGEAVVLRGKVTDEPIANAEVSAAAGGWDFAATADPEGNYEVEVIALGDPMVTLNGQGNGAQAAASLSSVVGGFQRLQDEAGGDGVLVREENNQVQVTNLSTAQAYLMEAANDGSPVASDEELELVREAVDLNAMLEMAGAIKLVVDGGYALPEGTENVYQMISNPAAFEQFVATVEAADPNALANAIAETVNDPEVTTPTPEDAFVGTSALLADFGRLGTIRVGLIHGETMELAADGTGNFVQNVANADPSVSWSYIDGKAVVVPNAPISYDSYVVVPEIGPFQIRRVNTDRQYEFVRLTEGNGRDTVAMTVTVDYSYPDYPGDPRVPPGTETYTVSRFSIRDGEGNLPYTAAEFPGQLALSYSGAATWDGAGVSLFDFAGDGTGTRLGDSRPFTWSLDAAGRLGLDYGDGSEARYTRLAVDGRGGEGVVTQSLLANGSRSSQWELSMRPGGIAPFDPGNVADSWRSGFYISPGTYSPGAGADDFYVQLTGPAQTGQYVTRSFGENYTTPLSWSAPGGDMRVLQYHDDTGYVYSCTVGVNGCIQWAGRRWRPVAGEGNRVYVIEELLGDLDSDGYVTDGEVRYQRANFYERALPPVDMVESAKLPASRVKKAVRKGGR